MLYILCIACREKNVVQGLHAMTWPITRSSIMGYSGSVLSLKVIPFTCFFFFRAISQLLCTAEMDTGGRKQCINTNDWTLMSRRTRTTFFKRGKRWGWNMFGLWWNMVHVKDCCAFPAQTIFPQNTKMDKSWSYCLIGRPHQSSNQEFCSLMNVIMGWEGYRISHFRALYEHLLPFLVKVIHYQIGTEELYTRLCRCI